MHVQKLLANQNILNYKRFDNINIHEIIKYMKRNEEVLDFYYKYKKEEILFTSYLEEFITLHNLNLLFKTLLICLCLCE